MKNILLIGDKLNEMFFKTLVEDQYGVIVIKDKSELYDVKNQDIVIVIIDLTFPKKENFDMITFLHQTSKFAQTPILINVIDDDDETIVYGLEKGAFDWITIPYNNLIVKKKILNAIQTVSLKDNINNSDDIEEIRKIVDNIPLGFGVFYMYPSNRVESIYLNDGYYTLINAARESRYKYKGISFAAAIYPDDIKEVFQSMLKAVNENQITSVDFRVLDGKGKFIWVNMHVKLAIKSKDKKIIYASFMNIDKIKKTKFQLESGQRILELANKDGKVSIWLFNIDKKRIVSGLTEEIVEGISEVNYDVPNSIIEQGMMMKEDEQVFCDMYNKIIKGAEKSECTIRIKNVKNGKFGWRHISLTRLNENPDGEQLAYGISMDIDMQYEMSLQYKREVKIRQELLKNSIIYFELNLNNNIVEKYKSKFVSDFVIKNNSPLNYEIKALITSCVYKDDLDIINTNLNSNYLIIVYNEGKRSLEILYRRYMPDGALHWVKATVSLVNRLDSDEIIAYIYIDDVNYEYIDQLALNNIVDEEIEAVCVINSRTGQGHVLRDKKNALSSDKEEKFVFDDFITNIVKKSVKKEDQKRCNEFFKLSNLIDNLVKDKSMTISFQAKDVNDKEGKTNKYIRKTVLAIFLDDLCDYIVISMRDTTKLYEEELKQKKNLEIAVENAMKANNAKSEFISRMSHDMRTPLNAVIGLVSLAKDEKNEGKLSNFLESIDDSSHFLLGLINDILDISRIESGKIELVEEPYSIEDFTRNVNTVIKPLMDKKHIKFNFDMGCGADNICVDKLRFCQIFFNLLSNSCKYTQEGGEVTFSAEHIPNDELGRHGMRYHVIDNGRGMSKEFQQKLFEPFTQENTINSFNQGSGLGLAIVKKLVDTMGGNIVCKSELGIGTEFIVDLYAFFEKDRIAEVEEEVDYTKLNGLHILLIEDNELNTIVAEQLLEKVGCIIDTASNGLVGCDRFRNSGCNYYDAILMDIRMPVMNGLDATIEIRSQDRDDAKTVVIIAMTADAFINNSNEVVRTMMNGYITKPIEPKELYKTIVKCVDKMKR